MRSAFVDFCRRVGALATSQRTSARLKKVSVPRSVRDGSSSSDGPDSAHPRARVRVFVSYSRKDAPFVDALQALLIARGYDAYLDRTDIAPAEDWRHRLDALILAADAVVFVVTDHSLASEICGWEIERTLELGKRIVPLVHGSLTAQLPRALKAINYVYSDAPRRGISARKHPTAECMRALASAIDVDIAWVREHARLTARAAEWKAASAGDRTAKLLRRGEVDASRVWMQLQPGPAAPTISEVLVAFIEASDAHESLERERLLSTIGRAFVEPTLHAAQGEEYDHSLRLAATGVLLSEDRHASRTPQLVAAAASALSGIRVQSVLIGNSGAITRGTSSSDGHQVVTGSEDGMICSWDVDTGSLNSTWISDIGAIEYIGASGKVICCANKKGSVRCLNSQTLTLVASFSPGDSSYSYRIQAAPDGRHLLLLGPEGLLLDVESAQLVTRFEPSMGGRSVALSADTIAVATYDEVVLVDRASGVTKRKLEGHSSAIEAIAFSPDGRRLVSTAYDDTTIVWDTMAGDQIYQLSKHGKDIASIKFTSDGSRFITVSEGGIVNVWNSADGANICSWRAHSERITDLTLDETGSLLATCSWDCVATVWQIETGARLFSLKGHQDGVSSICWVGPRRMLTTSYDKTARIWDARLTHEIMRPLSHPKGARSISFASSGALLVSAGEDHTARVWDVKTAEEVSCLKHADIVRNAYFSYDDSFVVTESYDGTACTWDPTNGTLLRKFEGHERQLRASALDPDCTTLATACESAKVRIWDIESGRLKCVLDGGDQMVHAVAFSPTGELIATAGHDGVAKVWSVASGQLLRILPGHERQVLHVEFSRDGAFLVSGSHDGSCNIWRTDNWTQVAQLRLGSGPITDVHFCPHSKRVLTCSEFGVISVYEVDSGIKLAEMRGPDGEFCYDASFSEDGSRVLSVTSDARIWDAGNGRCVEILRADVKLHGKASFSPDGSIVASICSDETLRVSDVSASRHLVGPFDLILTARLTQGRGARFGKEKEHLLLEAAPDDLAEAMLNELSAPERAEAWRIAEALRNEWDIRCYVPRHRG